MTTNLARLKGKGAPPAPDEAADVIAADPRSGPRSELRSEPRSVPGAEPQRPIQVRVPETVFAEFSERAGREFGFTHGAKKQLFLKMWNAYSARSL